MPNIQIQKPGAQVSLLAMKPYPLLIWGVRLHKDANDSISSKRKESTDRFLLAFILKPFPPDIASNRNADLLLYNALNKVK